MKTCHDCGVRWRPTDKRTDCPVCQLREEKADKAHIEGLKAELRRFIDDRLKRMQRTRDDLYGRLADLKERTARVQRDVEDDDA